MSGAGEPKVGDEVPNYRLVNQDGKAITLHDYKGKTLLLTFHLHSLPGPGPMHSDERTLRRAQSGIAETTGALRQDTPAERQLRS